MEKKKFRPIGFLIIGIIVLIVPTLIYLCFLIPQMKDEYIILMSSSGVIGGAGMFGTQMIPDKVKFGTLFKTASKSFTLLVMITLVQEFIGQLLGLIITFLISFIIFLVMKELWKDAKRAKQDQNLAAEVARSITETTK